MIDDEIARYLNGLQQQLLQPERQREIELTRDWSSGVPDEAGVYILIENDQIVYVGETGNLKGRMRDLLDSRNHVIRRTIGHTYYRDHQDFKMATSRLKFPDPIEILVSEYLTKKLKVSYLVVSLGRKELEERIQESIPSAIRLNKRGKRIKR